MAEKDYLSELEPNRIAGVELIKNRVELVHVLGGKEIVLHMYLPTRALKKSRKPKSFSISRHASLWMSCSPIVGAWGEDLSGEPV